MKFKLLEFGVVVTFLAVFTACSGTAPTVAIPTTASLATATTVPTVAPTAVPATAVPTTVPATVAPTSAPTASVQIALQGPDKSVQLVGLDGKAQTIAKLSVQLDEGVIYRGTNTVGNTLYTVSTLGPTKVFAINAQGANQPTCIPNVINGFAIQSHSGSSAPHLAWGVLPTSNESQVSAQLFISGVDCSQVKQIASKTYTSAGEVRALRPFAWSQDGTRLFYSYEPVGLGGYILFDGITDLWSYNLRDGKSTELIKENQVGKFVCIDSIAVNDQLVAYHCGDQNIRVLDLHTNKTTTIQPPTNVTDFHVLGTARFSPDSSRVAYALARREPDNEQGWVAVSQGLDGTSHLVASSPAKDYYEVAAWLDANTLLLQSHGTQPAVWTVGSDGTNLKKLTDGTYVGLLGGE